MTRVLFGGVFDLFHSGHLRALQEAKKLGDVLIVHVLNDERVRFKKGDNRPILSQLERAEVVRELRVVDEVICDAPDSQSTTIDLLDEVKPDIFCIDSSEHKDFEREERECKKRGIRLEKMPRIITESELCTTKIIEKITSKF